MKKILVIFAAFAALVSCRSLKDEWDPVFTTRYDEAYFVPVTDEYLQEHEGMESITSIADLKAMYNNKPLIISDNIWIKGQVISSDKSGNIYSEIYIQDRNGDAIDVKFGKGSLYNEYVLGQWLYIKCKDLTLGAYNGMPQLGMQADQTELNEYDTSYMNMQGTIDTHVFRGFIDEPVKPTVVTVDQIAESIQMGFNGKLWGKLVTLKGLTYGHTWGIPAIYSLLYPNPNLPHKSDNPENRIFLSVPQNQNQLKQGFDYTWGITSWGLTKADYIKYVQSGLWDSAEVDSGDKLQASFITRTPYEILMGTAYESRIDNFGMDAFSSYKDIMVKYASANYVSHYFTMAQSQDIQIRTSGYAKFASQQIPQAILDGAPVTVTGIASIYTGSTPVGVQISLIDEPSVSVVLE